MYSRFQRSMIPLACVVLVSAVAGGCGKQEEPASEPAPAPVAEPMAAPAAIAEAMFASLDGSIQGTATFVETDGMVRIDVVVEGAPAGTHGFHIHQEGDCSAEDFTSAGGHFNPAGTAHGGPADDERHAGDLGNIEIDAEGGGTLSLTSDLITLAAGERSVVGRAVILHAKADDLVSQPTGAAGARLACGVIEVGG